MPFLLYASGRHYAHWVDCRRWDCAKCAHDKLVDIAVNLVRQEEKVWSVTVPRRQVQAVQRSCRRVGSLRLYLPGGGLHLVTERETSGYGWHTLPRDSMDEATDIRRWAESGLRVPCRTIWTPPWSPPPDAAAERGDQVLYRRVFSSVDQAERWGSRYGIRPTNADVPPVPEPTELAARMRLDDTLGDVRNLL
jgi:hypothetical protein